MNEAILKIKQLADGIAEVEVYPRDEDYEPCIIVNVGWHKSIPLDYEENGVFTDEYTRSREFEILLDDEDDHDPYMWKSVDYCCKYLEQLGEVM